MEALLGILSIVWFASPTKYILRTTELHIILQYTTTLITVLPLSSIGTVIKALVKIQHIEFMPLFDF